MKYFPKTSCFLLLSLLLVGAAVASPFSVDRIEFTESERPLWTFSGAWASDEESFFLVDVLRNSILQFNLNGRLTNKLNGESLGIDDFNPGLMALIKESEEYIVESGEGSFFWFTKDFEPQKTLTINALAGNSGDRVLSVVNWTATSKMIFAFGDIQSSTGRHYSSHFVIPTGQRGAFETVGDDVPVDGPYRHLQYLGYSFSAPIPGSGREVVTYQSNPPRIVQIGLSKEMKLLSPRAQNLSLTTTFESDNPWTHWRPKTPIPQRFKDFESSTAVVSVFVSNDSFYLIHRHGKQWEIEKVNRTTLQTDGAKVIPTRAEHLTIIPGSEKLIVIEKGSVEALGDQRVEAFFQLDYLSLFP